MDYEFDFALNHLSRHQFVTMKNIIITILCVELIISSVQGYGEPKDFRDSADTLDIIKARGFIGEAYTISPYGYPLNLYRIINPLANPDTLNKYPVLYGHGVLFDSHSMISRSEKARPRKPVIGEPTINYGDFQGADDVSFPFMFSNNNFDVWLYDNHGVNDRGRNVSVDIDKFNQNSQKFWDFSLDDEALYDVPKLIDFVLMKTAATKLVYVGFSESTFLMFALMTRSQAYQDKIAAFIAQAPVAYVSHIRGLTVPAILMIDQLHSSKLDTNFLPQPLIDSLDLSLRNLCAVQGLSNLFCAPVVNSIGGQGAGEQSPSFFSHFFQSTSVKVVRHFIQLYRSNKFRMYDFGLNDNLKVYGRPEPPDYDLRNIKSDRIILARGGADYLSTPEDTAKLIAQLGHKPYLDIQVPHYNHFDFQDGKDLVRLFNGPAMIAVYQLLYKDGPNIIRTPEQNEIIFVNRHIGRAPTSILQHKLAAHDKKKESDLLNLPGFIKGLTGNVGFLKELRLEGAANNIFI